MRSWIRRVGGCLLAGMAGLAVAQPLPPEVDAALAQSRLPRDAVVVFVAPAGGAPRVAHRPDAAVNPASLAKLVTTFAALELLGPGYTWSTPVFADGPVQGGVLHGNLYLQGGGDPRLVVERMWLLLRRVQGLGIRRITGDIVLDHGAFQVPATDPGAFDNEPSRPYNAAPDALLLNFRSIVLTFTPEGAQARVQAEPRLGGVEMPATVPLSVAPCGDWRAGLRLDWSQPLRPKFGGTYPVACGERTWPIAYPDPPRYAAHLVQGLWSELGGQLGGRVVAGTVPAHLTPLLTWSSPPLAEVVRDVNKFSNNVMAQQLFLTLSLQKKGTGSFEGSREVVRDWWATRFGGEGPVLENGSGLSRQARLTARQLHDLLQAAWASPLMPDLVASLPLAGVDGTLRRSQRVAGQAHLKTGSLRDVTGVAGYVHGAGGRRFVLVAIANHPDAAAFRPVIETLVDWTARQP